MWIFDMMQKSGREINSILRGGNRVSTCQNFPQLGNFYGALTGGEADAVVVRFFGIFFAFFQSSAIWGALISSIGKLRNSIGLAEKLLG